MRLLVTRPAAEAAPLAEALAAAGHAVLVEPLLAIRPIAGAALSLDGVAALLCTSANGVRALAGLTPRRDLACYGVGEATAATARAAGFTRVESAGGDAAALAALVRRRCDPATGALLHAAGRERADDLAGALRASGYDVREAVLYEAVPAATLPPAMRAALAAGRLDGVLLFSPRSADSFARLVEAAGLAVAARRLTAWCLSPAVATALAPLEFGAVELAARPDQAGLIAAIARATGTGEVQE